MSPKWIIRAQGELAEVLGVSIQTIKNWRATGMPGKKREYDLAAILKWLRTEGPWKPKPAKEERPEPKEPAEPSALERKRLAEAIRAERLLAVEEGKLIPADIFHELHVRWAAVLRRAHEQMQRKHGAKVAKGFEDALKSCEAMVAEFFGEED